MCYIDLFKFFTFSCIFVIAIFNVVTFGCIHIRHVSYNTLIVIKKKNIKILRLLFFVQCFCFAVSFVLVFLSSALFFLLNCFFFRCLCLFIVLSWSLSFSIFSLFFPFFSQFFLSSIFFSFSVLFYFCSFFLVLCFFFLFLLFSFVLHFSSCSATDNATIPTCNYSNVCDIPIKTTIYNIQYSARVTTDY